MSAPCVFHCLDIPLAREWLNTCSEYLRYVLRPFSDVGPAQLWKCQQPSWEAAFKEWSVLQFWVGVATAVISAIISASYGFHLVTLVVEVVVQIAMAYVLAHLGWFAVVRKNGCFCCVVACCECPPILLLWGVLDIVWGLLTFAASLHGVSTCLLCFIKPLVQAVYSVILFYMGLCCIKLWANHGAEIVPPSVQVKGPEGQVVGAANIA